MLYIHHIYILLTAKICVVLNSQGLGNSSETELFEMIRPYCNNGKIYIALNKADDDTERGKH